MGIRIFLKEDKEREKPFRLEDKRKATVDLSLALVDSIPDLFSPEKVTEWHYLVGEEIGGELIETWTYAGFKSIIGQRIKRVSSYYSIFRINGEWNLGKVHWSGFVSVNLSPLLRDQGDIYMDINPAFFEDINDIINSQENKEEIIKDLVNRIKIAKGIEGGVMLTIRKIISEDEEYPIFIYSKDKAIAWKSAEEYLTDGGTIGEIRPIYNWGSMYDLFLKNRSARLVMEKAEKEFGVTEEAGSVLLIGSSRESLDNTFKELSVKLKSFMDKLEPKRNIEQKIDETFGGATTFQAENGKEE